MIVCIVVYLLLLAALWVNKKSDLFRMLQAKEKRSLFFIILASNLIATGLFAAEILELPIAGKMTRNSYGEGSKIESYEVTVEGELEAEPFEIEVQEREYTHSEIRDIFEKITEKLDEIILGENESFDRIEKDLNLVREIKGYPVRIQWELDNYEVLDIEGTINQENTKEEGTLVELRGTLVYGTEEAVYVTHVMIYPETKSGKEKWLETVRQSVAKEEEATRKEQGFSLPSQVLGKEIQWEKKKDPRGYFILLFGILICGLLLWKNKQEEKEEKQKRRLQMIRDYPDIISKFTLLLSTGMTVKNTWLKIVQGHEEQTFQSEKRAVYEEMRITCHEMKSGVSEAEAYERFGKRCEVAIYMKFGALLSQNLKKGGKGLSELLKLEAIQAFENRKSMARKMGEEAGTKLLIPMFGMLAVVMVMVIVPAFLSIQL